MAVPYEYGLNSKFHITYSLHNNKLLNPGENKNKNIYVHTSASQMKTHMKYVRSPLQQS